MDQENYWILDRIRYLESKNDAAFWPTFENIWREAYSSEREMASCRKKSLRAMDALEMDDLIRKDNRTFGNYEVSVWALTPDGKSQLRRKYMVERLGEITTVEYWRYFDINDTGVTINPSYIQSGENLLVAIARNLDEYLRDASL